MKNRFEFKQAVDFDAADIIAFWRANDISILRLTRPMKCARQCASIRSYLLLQSSAWRKRRRCNCRHGFVVHLATRRDLRGAGLGRELMDRLEDRFRAAGVWRIHLFVEKTNLDVVDYYLKCGYKNRDDLVLMSKTL